MRRRPHPTKGRSRPSRWRSRPTPSLQTSGGISGWASPWRLSAAILRRRQPTEDLELIESIVTAHAGGIRITDLEAELWQRRGATLNRRTLQRRLQKLIAQHRLSTEGESVALVYKTAAGARAYPSRPANATAMLAAEPELYVPLSPEGAVIRDLVRRPLMHRRPVGYQREFLDAYQPGTSFYLPEALRRQLHEMGRTSVSERPAGTYARDILGRLLVDLSWASSKLEGNTYSRLDTQHLIEFGQVAQGKDAIETQKTPSKPR